MATRMDNPSEVKVDYWLEDDNDPFSVTVYAPLESDGATVTLRFEVRDDALLLVDIHVFEMGAVTAVGRPRQTFGGPPFPDLPAGLAYTNTSEVFASRGSRTSETGLSVRMLRALSIGQLEEAARRALARGKPSANVPSEWQRLAPVRPGRRGKGSRFYAEVAASYDAAMRRPNPTPVAELARERHLSQSQVRNLVSEARRRGFLSKGRRGVAGGTLTDVARRVLKEN